MNFLFEIIRLGLHNLRLHKLRSFLTSLGIILGVAAVIVMVAIGEGNKQAALRDIQALGATNIIVRSVKPPESNSMGGQQRSVLASFGLLRRDLRRLEDGLSHAAHIVPLKQAGDEVSYRESRVTSQAFGTTPELLRVANLRMEPRGRYITESDLIAKAPVAVIGAEVANKFFRLKDPLGEEFRIGSQVFRVVGVLEPVGLAGGRGSALVGRDLNKDVHIPLTTAETLFGDEVARRVSGSFSYERVELSEIFITSNSTEDVMHDAALVRRIVAIDHADSNDTQVIVPWELLENAKRVQLVWNIVLIAIAAISLVVGGIGIMNIMLASVTERTREIGIRRALGATRRHIVVQFLVETGSLSAVGGLLGIALGVMTSLGLGRALPWIIEELAQRGAIDATASFDTQVTWWSIVASFLVSVAVGLIFGIYPAVVASKRDPIVALRHD